MDFYKALSAQKDIPVDFLPNRKIKDAWSFLEDLKIGKAEA